MIKQRPRTSIKNPKSNKFSEEGIIITNDKELVHKNENIETEITPSNNRIVPPLHSNFKGGRNTELGLYNESEKSSSRLSCA